MMKKLTSLVLALVMCLSLCIPALAAESEPERVIVEVDTLADAYEFLMSSGRDATKLYSFIIKYVPTSRAPCPNCGNAAWTGGNAKLEEVDRFSQQCPMGPDLGADGVDIMYYYYLERCRRCGYEIVHEEYYFDIYCESSFPGDPDGTVRPAFQARDGQDWQSGGYDIHEDKSTWWVVPAKYH